MAKKKLFGNLFKKRKKIKAKEPVEMGDVVSTKGQKMPVKEEGVQIINNPLPQVIKEDKIVEFMDAYGLSTQLEHYEKKMFSAIATEFQLNQFKREI